MKQMFLKASYGLGWGSSGYRVSLDGEGGSPFFTGAFIDHARVVISVDGTFSNLTVYSPVGAHPNYIATVMINDVASPLTCTLAPTAELATDRRHAIKVVAGDDIYISVMVNPPGEGVGYPLNVSLEFEGDKQFYAVGYGGSYTVDTYATGGALGNGRLQVLSAPTQLSNSYSICTTPGILNGIRMKTYLVNAGGSWIGYVTKNQVLQDGTGGTANTACTLVDGMSQVTSSFSLPIAVGDHVDFAILRTGTTVGTTEPRVAMSCLFTPTDPNSFMCCGGSNDATLSDPFEYKWMHSEQNAGAETIVKCPIGPRGIIVKGLRIELSGQPYTAANPTASKKYTVRKNGMNTAATVTITGLEQSAVISGLTIPFVDGDYIALEIQNIGNPDSGGRLHWGLSLEASVPVGPPPSSYHVDERIIRRLRRAPHLAQENVRLFYRRFELDLERGVGLATGQGSDPMVMVRLSRDGGHTWGEPMRMSAGRMGEYTTRVIARRLGQARDTVFEVTVSDPVAWSLVNAWLDLEAGTS
jgi:hypothetical protein